MALDVEERKAIAKDTMNRSPAIFAEWHETQSVQGREKHGNLSDSTFIGNQLAALHTLDPGSNPGHVPSLVRVIKSDSFGAAKKILTETVYCGRVVHKERRHVTDQGLIAVCQVSFEVVDRNV
ncbi:hypothetical protein K438DRAFT_1747438 [Mycena galopus ATCC 62051]|nr:hypothetical protein K438DRAFT_1747438 [Mycena galopus ATCC 62051]